MCWVDSLAWPWTLDHHRLVCLAISDVWMSQVTTTGPALLALPGTVGWCLVSEEDTVPVCPPSLHSRLTFPCRAAVLLPTVCFLVWQRISGEGWRITVWVIKQQLEFSVNKGEIMYTESNHPNFICTKDGLGVYFYNHKIGGIWRDGFYDKILI